MLTLNKQECLLDFIKFIFEQDPNETIYHNTWETCAVGDFCLSREREMLRRENLTRTCMTIARCFIGYEIATVPKISNLYQLLANAPCIECCLRTYGDLQRILFDNRCVGDNMDKLQQKLEVKS